MLILYKNDSNVKLVLFTKTSNQRLIRGLGSIPTGGNLFNRNLFTQYD